MVIASTVPTLFLGVDAQQLSQDKITHSLFNPTPTGDLRAMNTDRPDKTDSPITVDAGHVQLEMDLANFTYGSPNSAHGYVTTEDYRVAPLNCRIGVLSDMDIQLVVSPWEWNRVKDEGNGKVEQKSGFGDIVLRDKVNLVGVDTGFFALALVPFLKLPTAQDHLGNGAVEGGLGIPFAFDVPGWDVGFESAFSYNRNDTKDGYHAEIENSVSIGHALIGALSYHWEFFSSVSAVRNSGWIGTFDTWFTYPIDENLIVDTGVYIGVSNLADNWHPWIGMAWRY